MRTVKEREYVWEKHVSATRDDDKNVVSNRNSTLHTGWIVRQIPVETNYRHPILVVCYTNHALDQFLEAIVLILEEMGLAPNEHLIRIGGQSKSEVMQNLLLHKQLEVAKVKGSLPFQLNDNLKASQFQLKNAKQKRLELIENLRVLRGGNSLLNLKRFFALIRKSVLCVEDEFMEYLEPLHRDNQEHELEKVFGLDANYFYRPNFQSSLQIRNIFGSAMQKRKMQDRIHNAPAKSFRRNESVAGAGSSSDQGILDSNIDLEHSIAKANRVLEIEFELADQGQGIQKDFRNFYLINPYGDARASARVQSLYHTLNSRETQVEKHNRGTYQHNREMHFAKMRYRRGLEVVERQYSTVKDILGMYHHNRLTLDPISREGLEGIVKNIRERILPSPLTAWTLYFQLLEKCKDETLKKILELEGEIADLDSRFKEAQNSCYTLLLKQVAFVGMTTTGAAKYNTLLPHIESKLGSQLYREFK